MLIAVALVLTAASVRVQLVATTQCNCSGQALDGCSWSSWSAATTFRFKNCSATAATAVVWRNCSCGMPACYETKCESYVCGEWGSWDRWSAGCAARMRSRRRSCATSSNVSYSDASVTRSSETDTAGDRKYTRCPTSSIAFIGVTISTTQSANSSQGLQTWLIALVAASSALALVTLIIIAIYFCRRRRGKASVRTRSRVERSNSFFVDIIGGSLHRRQSKKRARESEKSDGENNANPADRVDNTKEDDIPHFTNFAFSNSASDTSFANN